jgi:hypothetical protein
MLTSYQAEPIAFLVDDGFVHDSCLIQENQELWDELVETWESEDPYSHTYGDSVGDRFAEELGVERVIRYTIHEQESELASDDIDYLCEQQEWADLPDKLLYNLIEAFREAYDEHDTLTWDDGSVTVDVFGTIERFVYDSDVYGIVRCVICDERIS